MGLSHGVGPERASPTRAVAGRLLRQWCRCHRGRRGPGDTSREVGAEGGVRAAGVVEPSQEEVAGEQGAAGTTRGEGHLEGSGGSRMLDAHFGIVNVDIGSDRSFFIVPKVLHAYAPRQYTRA